MITFLTNYYREFMALVSSNQVIAGAVSLWGLSVLTWIVRGIPTKIMAGIIRQSTTSFSVSNAGNDGNQHRYNAILQFITTLKGVSFSRTLKLRTVSSWSISFKNVNEEILPGNGRHYFIYKGRLFWFVRSSLASEGSYMEKEQMTIMTLGRNHQPFYDLILDALPTDNPREIGLYRYTDSWNQTAVIQKRNIETVVIPGGIKEEITSNIELFLKSKEWYISRGLSYKEVTVLTGPPGTGKTSLVKALASHFDLPVYELAINSMSDITLQKALTSIPSHSICLIDDFDDCTAVCTRRNIQEHKSKNTSSDKNKKEEEKAPSSKEVFINDYSFLTLSGILNALDGVMDLPGVLIFMNTNCIDSIDPAILRKGRTDFIYTLDWFTDKEVRQYASVVFPGIEFPLDVTYGDIAGCDVYALFKEHRDDPATFLSLLPVISNGE